MDSRVADQIASLGLESLPPDQMLRCCLKIKAIITTSSSYSARLRDTDHFTRIQNCQEIGAGLQGIVYEQLGTAYVTKKELPTNQGRHLRDEFAMHKRVSDAFERYEEHGGGRYRHDGKDYTAAKGGTEGLDSEVLPREKRAPSRPNTGREGKQALPSTYLPREGGGRGVKGEFLRNIPLALDAMDDLALDAVHFAAMIGNAYALMHWAANITGDDVEFVLGTSASGDYDSQHRKVHMYLLDFGQCDEADMNGEKEDIFQTFKGSMVLQQNQPYLSHPRRRAALYQAWRSAYLSIARYVIERERLLFDSEEFVNEYEEYLEDFDP
ncbi:uncharacterized protein F4822DRAFT_434652 [Hypoxylon trugodes]|uniref:uncharacterized protein n=1 Tax=Hypoxylon trugodes TaxID=326681 RepID=UPI00219B0E5B|nr:uncharacterized protein F4822DRAFT_434652 [Hypoxylon trugodes]KAI1383540.1 hypothetical protein F4822DRAFT_434652 [Hypoxylon trugodes]